MFYRIKLFDKLFPKNSCSFSSKINRPVETLNYYTEKKKKYPTDIALNHFDSFYPKIYGEKWKSIRIALLSPNKHVAIVNTFSDVEEINQKMKMLKAVSLKKYYEKHWKQVERYKIRKNILKKRSKDKKLLCDNKIDSDSIQTDIEYSNDELDRSDLELTSSPEDASFLFETDSYNDEQRFFNAASTNLNLNSFVPATEIISYEDTGLEMLDDNRNLYSTNFSPIFIEEKKLDIPDELIVYINPRGVITYLNIDEEDDDLNDNIKKLNGLQSFPHPNLNKKLNIWDYYVMDAASILPVLCLGIQYKDVVADYCASPGGKSLAMMYTLRPSKLLLNEFSFSRFSRLKKVIYSYIPKLNSIKHTIDFRNSDASTLIQEDAFDKILIDAPCTNDRLSLHSNENNYYKSTRLRERMEMPQKQMEIFLAGLYSLKKGGSLVYSTCSLNLSQNDGVVEMALRKAENETDKKYVINNLKETLRPLRGLYRLMSMKYGEQVLPFLPSNSGPMYISKITRIN